MGCRLKNVKKKSLLYYYALPGRRDTRCFNGIMLEMQLPGRKKRQKRRAKRRYMVAVRGHEGS